MSQIDPRLLPYRDIAAQQLGKDQAFPTEQMDLGDPSVRQQPPWAFSNQELVATGPTAPPMSNSRDPEVIARENAAYEQFANQRAQQEAQNAEASKAKGRALLGLKPEVTDAPGTPPVKGDMRFGGASNKTNQGLAEGQAIINARGGAGQPGPQEVETVYAMNKGAVGGGPTMSAGQIKANAGHLMGDDDPRLQAAKAEAEAARVEKMAAAERELNASQYNVDMQEYGRLRQSREQDSFDRKKVAIDKAIADTKNDMVAKGQAVAAKYAQEPKMQKEVGLIGMAMVAIGGIGDVLNAKAGAQSDYAKRASDQVQQFVAKQRQEFLEARERGMEDFKNHYSLVMDATKSQADADLALAHQVFEAGKSEAQRVIDSATSVEAKAAAELKYQGFVQAEKESIVGRMQQDIQKRATMEMNAQAAAMRGAGGGAGKPIGQSDIADGYADPAIRREVRLPDGSFVTVPKEMQKEAVEAVEGLQVANWASQNIKAELKKIGWTGGGLGSIPTKALDSWFTGNNGRLESLAMSQIMAERKRVNAGAIDEGSLKALATELVGKWRNNPLEVIKAADAERNAAAQFMKTNMMRATPQRVQNASTNIRILNPKTGKMELPPGRILFREDGPYQPEAWSAQDLDSVGDTVDHEGEVKRAKGGGISSAVDNFLKKNHPANKKK